MCVCVCPGELWMVKFSMSLYVLFAVCHPKWRAKGRIYSTRALGVMLFSRFLTRFAGSSSASELTWAQLWHLNQRNNPYVHENQYILWNSNTEETKAIYFMPDFLFFFDPLAPFWCCKLTLQLQECICWRISRDIKQSTVIYLISFSAFNHVVLFFFFKVWIKL